MGRIGPMFLVEACALGVLVVIWSMTSIAAAELGKLSLDSAASLGTTISTDTNVKLEGNGSVRISTSWPTTICLGELFGLDVENAMVVYQARARCEQLEGQAFLEMWCHVGGGQYFSRGLDSIITGTSDWKTLRTPFILKAGQKAKKITLNIVINGKGTVWIDDARLLEQPLK